MPGIDLHSPEHPQFPREAEHLRNPDRAPTEHERWIAEVFSRFEKFPNFETLPPASAEEKAEALARLDELVGLPPEIIQDQDDRVIAMCATVSEHPAVFGETGFYLASEIMRACRTIETSEFRRAFVKDYEPSVSGVRKYLRELAALRRRAN